MTFWGALSLPDEWAREKDGDATLLETDVDVVVVVVEVDQVVTVDCTDGRQVWQWGPPPETDRFGDGVAVSGTGACCELRAGRPGEPLRVCGAQGGGGRRRLGNV